MEIYMFIALALRVLPRLDPLVYPNLCYYRDKTTVIKHLEAVLHLFESQERPVVTIEDKAYFLFSQRYIRLWSKDEADCGGTHERWQAHKIFLMDLGLIETYTVTGQSDNPVLNQIWNKAKEKKQNCEQLWTIPFYDDDLLQQAERIAGLYHEYGINIAHLRKNVVIRFRGQKRANWLYADRRVINQAEKTMLEYCRTAIRLATAEKGYATFKEIEKRARAAHNGRPYYQQIMAELMHPEETEIRDPYTAALALILEEKALLCHEVGCTYRQIRKTDREELNIPKELKSWIIVPKHN